MRRDPAGTSPIVLGAELVKDLQERFHGKLISPQNSQSNCHRVIFRRKTFSILKAQDSRLLHWLLNFNKIPDRDDLRAGLFQLSLKVQTVVVGMAWDGEFEAADAVASSKQAEMNAHAQLDFSSVVQPRIPQPTGQEDTHLGWVVSAQLTMQKIPSEAYAEDSLSTDPRLCQVDNNHHTLHIYFSRMLIRSQPAKSGEPGKEKNTGTRGKLSGEFQRKTQQQWQAGSARCTGQQVTLQVGRKTPDCTARALHRHSMELNKG